MTRIVNTAAKSSGFRSTRASLIVRALVLLIGVALISLVFSDNPAITGGPGLGLLELALIGAGTINVLAALWGGMAASAWLVIQVSVLLTLGVAEVALRATVGPRYTSPFQLHERYLYALVPGAVREYRQLPENGENVVYRVNEHGFRGESFTVERGAARRVLIYGDSFIQAEYTPLAETFARQLEALLTESTGESVEVLNGGVAGYGPDQVLLRITDELEWLQPDLVVVGIFSGNDFGDLLRNKLYRLQPNGELLKNAYTLSEEIQLNAALEVRDPILRKMGREVKTTLQILLAGGPPPAIEPLQRTEDRLQQHLREYREYIVEGDNVVRDLRSDPYSADIALLPDSPSAQYKLRMMDAVLADIGRVAAAQNVPLVTLGIPHPMDLLDGNHASGAVDLQKYPAYRPSRLTDSLQTIADRHAIDHINLYPAFRSHEDPASLYLLGGDDHWNSAGQAKAADVVTGHVLQRGYLKPRD